MDAGRLDDVGATGGGGRGGEVEGGMMRRRRRGSLRDNEAAVVTCESAGKVNRAAKPSSSSRLMQFYNDALFSFNKHSAS